MNYHNLAKFDRHKITQNLRRATDFEPTPSASEVPIPILWIVHKHWLLHCM